MRAASGPSSGAVASAGVLLLGWVEQLAPSSCTSVIATPLAPLDLALFALWCFLVALAGGLVGLVLGNIRLPAMLLVASSAAAGGGANLAISAIAALTAAIAHIRAGRINWRLFAWMAPPSVVGAVAGGVPLRRDPGRAAAARDRRRAARQSAIELLRDAARRRAGGDGGDARHPRGGR